MRKLFVLFVCLQGAIFAAPAKNKPIWTYGLHNQNNRPMILAPPIPEGFKETSCNDGVMEYVPEGECCCEWTQKIRIEVLEGGKPGELLKRRKDRLQRRFKRQCLKSDLSNYKKSGIPVFQYFFDGPSLAKQEDGKLAPLAGVNEIMGSKAVRIDLGTFLISYMIRYEKKNTTQKEKAEIEAYLQDFLTQCGPK